MRAGAALLLAVGLAGCATWPASTTCPKGQQDMRSAQLFLGRKDPTAPVTEVQVRRFIDQEITPRFPDGVTVLDGGGQWRGPDDRLLRNAVKVVLFILPAKGDILTRIDAVRAAYQTQFRQESVLILTQPACVAL